MNAAQSASAYRIVAGRPRDLPSLPTIELAAARLLAGHAPQSVLNETSRPEEFLAAQTRGHLWVALADEIPVGFAQIELLESGSAHLKEIDVLPEHGRQGLGTQLVMAACFWAANSGYDSVTLTTFCDVPFNGPFYAKLGFERIPREDLSPALFSILKTEAEHGLDPSRRVALRRKCRP